MESNKKIYVGKDLKKLRQKIELSQEQMAEELGVSQSYYSSIESGKKPISQKMESLIVEKWPVHWIIATNKDEDKPKHYFGGIDRGYTEQPGAFDLAKEGGYLKMKLTADIQANHKEVFELYNALNELDFLSRTLANFLPVITLENIGNPSTYLKWKNGLANNHPLKLDYKTYQENVIGHLQSIKNHKSDIVKFRKQLLDFLSKMRPLDIDHEIILPQE
jgi:transcriptional regulator with XRE-family HTH domain